MNLQSIRVLEVNSTMTHLDGYGHGLELGRVNTSVRGDLNTYGRAKLIIDFFSIVPFSNGTASSGLSALGRSAETWFQIYALLVSLG